MQATVAAAAARLAMARTRLWFMPSEHPCCGPGRNCTENVGLQHIAAWSGLDAFRIPRSEIGIKAGSRTRRHRRGRFAHPNDFQLRHDRDEASLADHERISQQVW